MKSLFITFLIFAAVYLLMKFGILDIVGSFAFQAIVAVIFIAVMACALYFVGVPKLSFDKNTLKNILFNSTGKKENLKKDVKDEHK